MITKRSSFLAWGLMLLSTGMIFFASFAGGFQRDPGLYLPIALVYIGLGGLLAIRIPENAIGWIFLVGVWFLIINVGMAWYAKSGLVVNPGSLPGADVVAAVMGVFEVFGYALLLIFPFLLFPNGKLISERWKPVLWLAGFAMVLEFLEIFRPGQLVSFPDWSNPLGITQLSGYFEVSGYILGILALVLFAVGPVSIILRYRRASTVERQQIKWVVFAGIIVSIWILFVTFFYDSMPEIIGILLESIVLASLPLAIAIAIFRYRLWDIDIIIRRTLQYTLLTGMLLLIYFGSVVLLENLVGSLTGRRSPMVIAISTLAIVILFNPLRTRIQDFIDRYFYRQRYDAEKTLNRFAVIARDEVDLDKLATELLEVVEDTIQPESAVLWLKSNQSSGA